jgi:hypothetical protein
MTLCNYAVNYSTCVTLARDSSSVVKREEKETKNKKDPGFEPQPWQSKKQYDRPCIFVRAISFGRHDTQNKDIQHNDTWHEGLICDTQHELTLCNYAVNYSTHVTSGSDCSSVVKRKENKNKKDPGLNPNPGKVKNNMLDHAFL